MKIIAFLAMLLATGITAVTLPSGPTFNIVENGTRIEMFQIPLDIANKQIQESNRSSPDLSDPPKPQDPYYVCQDPPRALDILDDFDAALRMLYDLCSTKGVDLSPDTALSVTSGDVRVSVCAFLVETRCDVNEMYKAWVTLNDKCPLHIEGVHYPKDPAGFVFGDGGMVTYQREACEDTTICGMNNVPCEPVP